MDEPFELRFDSGWTWWVMTWPAVLCSIAPLFILPDTTNLYFAIGLMHTIVFVVKTLLIRRAIQREYRTFWIGVVRGTDIGRTITWREQWLIARRHTVPPLVLIALMALSIYIFGFRDSFLGPLYILWFIGISDSRNDYRGFRLQGYRCARTSPSLEREPDAGGAQRAG